MRGFVFKLEGVLEQRRHVETCCQRALAEAHRQMMHIEREINQVAAVEKSAMMPLRGRIDPRTLSTQVRFSQVMRQKLATLREHLAAAREELAAAQAALVEAAKQRKVLEKLQEKQQARFVAEQQKHETSAQDELAQQMSRGNDDSSETFPTCPP